VWIPLIIEQFFVETYVFTIICSHWTFCLSW
jgi:hypothetical protein